VAVTLDIEELGRGLFKWRQRNDMGIVDERKTRARILIGTVTFGVERDITKQLHKRALQNAGIKLKKVQKVRYKSSIRV
jgi:hypothetical protein